MAFTVEQVAAYLRDQNITDFGQQQSIASAFGVNSTQLAQARAMLASGNLSGVDAASGAYQSSVANNPTAAAANNTISGGLLASAPKKFDPAALGLTANYTPNPDWSANNDSVPKNLGVNNYTKQIDANTSAMYSPDGEFLGNIKAGSNGWLFKNLGTITKAALATMAGAGLLDVVGGSLGATAGSTAGATAGATTAEQIAFLQANGLTAAEIATITGVDAATAGAVGAGAVGAGTTGVTSGTTAGTVGAGTVGAGTVGAGTVLGGGLTLDNITQWAKNNAGSIGAVVGALGGSMDSTKTDAVKKEPWAEAAPWMKANIAKGQALQSFYEKNPFNDQQKTGYQNLFNGINGFNQSIPGLLEFANKGMGSNYQRATGGAVGSGGGYGGARVAGGLLQSGVNPFASPQTQNYGLLDWKKLIGG